MIDMCLAGTIGIGLSRYKDKKNSINLLPFMVVRHWQLKVMPPFLISLGMGQTSSDVRRLINIV